MCIGYKVQFNGAGVNGKYKTGAMPYERPSAWHVYIKIIFDQGGVGRVQ